jgi:hypothetical protein
METGAHSTSIGEPVAGPDVISPAMYRKYPWRFEKQMADDLRAAGVILHNHICGNAVPIAEDFIGRGAGPRGRPQGGHPPDEGRRPPPGVPLRNIDTGLLSNGTPGQVDAACRELIEA